MANIRVGRKSGFIERGGRMRRESVWLASGEIFTTFAAANTAVLLTSLGATLLALRPFTVVRTRGILSIQSDQAAAIENQFFAYGHCVVSDQATAIGVTAVPTPDTDDTSDLWFVYERLMNRTSGGLTDLTSNLMAVRYFDSKAMRKVEDGQDLISVGEASVNSSGLSLTSHFRELIKLH